MYSMLPFCCFISIRIISYITYFYPALMFTFILRTDCEVENDNKGSARSAAPIKHIYIYSLLQ